MTMGGSKGLKFPVVAMPVVGHMPAKGEDEQEAERVFYVAATRATQRLVIGWVGMAKKSAPIDCAQHSVETSRAATKKGGWDG